MLKPEQKIFANIVRDQTFYRKWSRSIEIRSVGLSMNPWFSRSSSQNLRSNSQKGEWNGFKEHLEKRPLTPLTNGVTPFLETPFKNCSEYLLDFLYNITAITF